MLSIYNDFFLLLLHLCLVHLHNFFFSLLLSPAHVSSNLDSHSVFPLLSPSYVFSVSLTVLLVHPVSVSPSPELLAPSARAIVPGRLLFTATLGFRVALLNQLQLEEETWEVSGGT